MLPVRILSLSRRAFGRTLAGSAVAAVSAPASRAAAEPARPAADAAAPALRDAMLRGLALAGRVSDTVQVAAAETALQRLAETDPEGALLVRIYRAHDAPSAAYWAGDISGGEAKDTTLALLHGAIRESRPVALVYIDAVEQETRRTVLPLALVHPPQGVKLLAYCRKREDFRQFFVRSIKAPSLRPGTFAQSRIMLLQGMLDRDAARA